MKSILLISLQLLTGLLLAAQPALNLQECYDLAKQNYPLIKQRELIMSSEQYSMDNLKKTIWPQLQMQGQLTTQSEVAKINIPIPNVSIPSPSYNQYKVNLDITQPITDVFLIKNQKAVLLQNSEVQLSSTEVELYKIKDRINQLYFGLLLIHEQLNLNTLLDHDLESGQQKIQAAIQQGTDYKTSANKIQAQIIVNQQRRLELESLRDAYLQMLSQFLNKPLNENTTLTTPASLVNNHVINRPELNLFSNRIKAYQTQHKIIKNRIIPKLSLFAQVGIGQPSPLNFLNNKMAPFAIGGLRANWNLSSLYSQKNDLNLLQLDIKNTELQKELFLFNTLNLVTQQSAEVDKLTKLLETDDELIDLRSSIKTTANVQLENGVISANDYIREANAEDQARQNKLLHQIQLLIAQYNIQYTSSN